MSISSPGVGSGLDVNSLVKQLVAAERAPTDVRIGKQETTTKSQISAFGAIRSAMAGLQGAVKRYEGDGALAGRKVVVAPEAGFTASGSAAARIGSYQVTVENLATAHKLQSAAVASGTQVGYGRLSITVGSDAPINVDIASGKGRLSDIRDAINTAAAGKGITATIVRGDSGDVLALTSTKTGSAGAIGITTSGGDGGLGVLATSGGTMTEVVPARNAKVVIDGVVRTSSSNTLSDAIDGISLTLTRANPGQPASLEVAADNAPLKASLVTFVSSYNTALTQLRTQSASGGEGKVAGPLSGDAAPRSMIQNLRNIVASRYPELATLGFKTATDGSLSLDGAKFDAAVAADPEAVNRLFGTGSPVGDGLRKTLDSYVGPGGLVTGRSDALNSRMKSIDRQKANFDARIATVEQAYRRQFTALDGMVSKLQSTSAYLSQQLAALGNRTGN